jgi:integrase
MVQRHEQPRPVWGDNEFTDNLYVAVMISLQTGCRRGELMQLQWPQVDLEQRLITFVGETTKGKRTRHIPINSSLLPVLKVWRSQTGGRGRLFQHADGSEHASLKKAWVGLLKKAKIERFRWHDMRHNAGSKMTMAGIPLRAVQDLLGHADPSTTARYSHLAPEHQRAAIETLAAKPRAKR